MQRRDRGGSLMASVWAPAGETIPDSALVARIESMVFAGGEPRQPRLLDMLGSLSQHILQAPATRRMPQYVALAYWLRPAALARLDNELGQQDRPGLIRVPRGVALHLPPSNVDTIFVYSWAMSVLAGNANIVRLPAQLKPEQASLVSIISEVVATHDEAHRNLFCHYDYGGETEKAISRYCDLRMIWGGDAKVEAVSRVPIRPDGLSIGFPDRQSFAIIATHAYGAADEAARDALVTQFFNDVYWFDQMGCGSPRLLVWLDDPGSLADDFYRRLLHVIDERGYAVEPGVTLSKFTLANDLLAEGAVDSYRRFGNALDVCRVVNPAGTLGRPHGGGFLCEWVTSLEEVPHIVTRKVQTIAYFGLAPSELLTLAKSISGRGGYRIVPIGQALQFDPVWDGVQLFEHMTRRIIVR